MSNRQQTTARPLASEQVTVGTPEGAVKLPEPPLIYRYEMYCRTPLGDFPVKDEEGHNVVYTDVDVAIAHLEMLPVVNREDPFPSVYFYRAVHELNPDGTSKHWFNRLRREEILDKATGEIRYFVHRGDAAAMQDFRKLRNERINATAQARRALQALESKAYSSK